MTSEEFDEFVEQELPKFTALTLVDPHKLRDAVEIDRQLGYSYTIGERIAGSSAVAAPFFDSLGRCRGSIVLSRPMERHSDDDMPGFIAAVTNAARSRSKLLRKVSGTSNGAR